MTNTPETPTGDQPEQQPQPDQHELYRPAAPADQAALPSPVPPIGEAAAPAHSPAAPQQPATPPAPGTAQPSPATQQPAAAQQPSPAPDAAQAGYPQPSAAQHGYQQPPAPHGYQPYPGTAATQPLAGQAGAFGQPGAGGQPQHQQHQQPAQHPAQGQPAQGQPAQPGQPGQPSQPAQPGQPAAKKPANRAGMITAGVLAAALLGGGAGAGVTAAMLGQSGGSVGASQPGTVTITNPENATAVSAIAQKATPSVVTLQVIGQTGAGTGSGVVISDDGYIITNAHVVTLDGEAAEQVAVRVFLSDGRILSGTVVGTDPYSDLAVVKVTAENLTPIEFADSDELTVGDLTVAIGAPLSLASTVTSGVVSALNRGISVGSTAVPEDPNAQDPNTEDPGNGQGFEFNRPDQQGQAPQSAGKVTLPVVQTDASINPGNSGGALLNGSGELIGVNVAIASTGGAQGTAGSVGLGFAVPSNLAKRVADSLIAGTAPSHGLLGVTVGDAGNAENAVRSGALLGELTPRGPAAKAGLKSGDVVTTIDGTPVADGTSLSALVRSHEGGSEVTLGYLRDGKAAETDVTLGTLGE